MSVGSGLTAVTEDYLEAILKLSAEKGAARVKDLAAELSVHKSTVSATLKGLAEKGLVDYSPYEMARLTPRGEVVAGEVSMSHEVIRRFLTSFLGVDDAVAGENACRMEHVMDAGVRERLAALMRFDRQNPVSAKFRSSFENHMKNAAAQKTVGGRSAGAAVLADLEAGDFGIVSEVRGGRSAIHRLAEMGIAPGVPIRLIRGHGPAIVECRGHRLIIGRGMVGDILVEQRAPS